jgi:hypothetical protein
MESALIRLNIAVDDSGVVGDFKRGTAVGNDACRDYPVVRASLLKVLSSASRREQLHHNVTLAFLTRYIVDGNDIWVIEPTRHLGFTHEPLTWRRACEETY